MAEVIVKLPRNIIAELKVGTIQYIYLNDFSFMYTHLRDNKEILHLYVYDEKLESIVGAIRVAHILRSPKADFMWLYTGKYSPFRKDEYDAIFIDPEEEAYLCIFGEVRIFNHAIHIRDYTKKGFELPKYYSLIAYGTKRKYVTPTLKMAKLRAAIKYAWKETKKEMNGTQLEAWYKPANDEFHSNE